MKSTVLFKTKSGNRYFYSFKKNRMLLCHPFLYYLIEMYLKGADIEQWINGLENKSIDIDGIGSFSIEDVKYHYGKLLLLKDQDYLENIDRKCRLSGRIDADTIKATLANMRQITFEVTDSCNLKCEYCGYGKFYEDYDKRENVNLDIDVAKKIIDYLVELWNSPLNSSHDSNIYISFYGGEPLMNMPFLKEIVKYTKNLNTKHNRFTYSMTTNALLLEKNMDFIVENKFNTLISLDGNKENTGYRVFHNGKPAYEQIIKNIMALKKKYPKYFKEKVNFNAVLHNKNSVSALYEYFKKNFGKTPSIGEMNDMGIKDSKKEEFWNTYKNYTESLFQSENYTKIEKRCSSVFRISEV